LFALDTIGVDIVANHGKMSPISPGISFMSAST